MKFWLDGDRLAYRVPYEGMTDELRSEIILHKADLIAMLQQERLAATSQITRAPFAEESEWPLASGQERLWLIESRIGATPLHNLHFRLLWKGVLDREKLAGSLSDIAARHAVLRTTIIERDGAARAIVSADAAVDLEHLDLRDRPRAEKVGAAESFILAHQRTPFDLEIGPLMRTAVITLADDDHIVLVTQHHIVTDGWSTGIFLAELSHGYRARCLGQGEPLPELPLRYSDYARWQHERQEERPYQEHLAWWTEHLAGLSPLALPGARHGYNSVPDHSGTTQDFLVPLALAVQLKDLARERCSTLYTVLLTAWAILLHRYSGQCDFAVGTVTGGRDQMELQSLIGFFANTLVLRCDLSGNPSVVSAIERLHAETESALEHEVQFADVILATGAVRDAGLNPLIQAAFIFENIPMPEILNCADVPEIAANVTFDPQVDGSAQGTSKFDLALFMQDRQDGIRGCFKYADAQFLPSAFERIDEHFLILLQSIAGDPHETVGSLELISASERQQLLAEWNDTGALADTNFLAEWSETGLSGL
jgi:hypothetical protein